MEAPRTTPTVIGKRGLRKATSKALFFSGLLALLLYLFITLPTAASLAVDGPPLSGAPLPALALTGSLLQVESATVAPAETVSVAIIATVPTTAGLNAFTIHIQYDPTIAGYGGCAVGGDFTGFCNRSNGDGLPPDVVSFSAVNPIGVNGEVEIGTITFSGAALGTTALHIEAATWSDGSATPPVTVDGQFTVQIPPTETPTPTATNTPEPTATNTPEPTATNTPEPTATNTPEPTATNTPEPTATNTPEPTATNTPEPTATNSPEPTATNTPEPDPTIHIGDLDGNSVINGNRWTAYVLVTVHDSSENPVADATVSGFWSSGTGGNGSCVTNSSGQCTISSGTIRGNIDTATFTVNNLTHPAHSYQPGDNHDPDGDSDGTTIELSQQGPPSPTPTPTITPTPGPGVIIHVGDLDGSGTAPQSNRWSATVTITVHDAEGNPIAGAIVSGSWNNGAFGSGSCVTNAVGQCSIAKNSIRSNIPSVTFTVDNIISAENTYNPAANHDPDDDSNGTTITISSLTP